MICINVSNTMRIPTLVLEKQFTTESGASVILSVMLAMGIFSGLSFGRLQKLFREKLTAISMLLVGLGLLLIALAGNLALVVAGAVLCGFFYTVVLTCIFNTVSDRLPLALVNTATSEVLVGCNLGRRWLRGAAVIGFCSGASVAPFLAYAVAAANHWRNTVYEARVIRSSSLFGVVYFAGFPGGFFLHFWRSVV